MGRHKMDLTGQKFNRLTAVSPATGSYWLWRCECGTEKIIVSGSVKNGNTQSCGCLHRERARGRPGSHGMSRTPDYRLWYSIYDKCRQTHKYQTPDRTMCERWKTFENFYADMGPRPKGARLIRLNPDAGFVTGNCRWSSDS